MVAMCVVLMATPCYGFTRSQANAYYRGVSKLGNIQKVCDANGYMSALTDASINAMYPYYKTPIYGITDHDRKLILVGSYQSDNYIERSIIHEYAHSLAHIGGLDVNGVEDILYTEMPYMVGYKLDLSDTRSTYCMTNKHEYFAEAMVEYYMNPKMLRLYCPMTYNYMRQVNMLFN